MLKRKKVKLQQAIQERLSKVEKIKLSVDRSRENPKEALVQAEERVRQLEEEIFELQRRNAELEQLSQTEDHLHFLQVRIKKTAHHSRFFLSHKFLWSLVSTEISTHCFDLTTG